MVDLSGKPLGSLQGCWLTIGVDAARSASTRCWSWEVASRYRFLGVWSSQLSSHWVCAVLAFKAVLNCRCPSIQDLQSLPWSKGSSYCQNIYNTTSDNPDMGRPTQNVTSNKAFPVISIKELLVVSFSLATGWGYNLNYNSNFYICSWLYGDFTSYTLLGKWSTLTHMFKFLEDTNYSISIYFSHVLGICLSKLQGADLTGSAGCFCCKNMIQHFPYYPRLPWDHTNGPTKCQPWSSLRCSWIVFWYVTVRG